MMGSTRVNWLRSRLLVTTAAASLLAASTASVATAAVTPDNTTPGNVVDTGNTSPYWVGVAIRGEAGNTGGTCTGLIINPRTVLFAAHCVDSTSPTNYDAPTSPGNRAQVGYTTDPTFGRTNLREWLFGLDFAVPAGDARVMSASSVMVWYDPRSRNGSAAIPGNGTFLPADIAIAGFDTPTELLGRDAASGLGLLFSPVTSLVPVRMGGYGQSGNGFDGTRTASTAEESYFRRIVNNRLGYLGDERSLSLGIYPTATADLLSPPGLLYQDLYWADFDDPSRATRPFFNGPGTDPVCPTTNANCRLDHDPFPGAAVTGEGITAAGDSGSPLATSAFGREVSLGVLSQGSRFFYESLGNPDDNFVRFTNFANFGTVAGYNPLFLFWDQIVVNNPYKYVTVVAGDGEWTDPTRWVQEIDPLYMILSGSTAVNGLPSTPALGVSNATPNVGTINASPSPAATCAFTGTCPATGGTDVPMPDIALGKTALPGTTTLPGTETADGATQITSGGNSPTTPTGGEGVIPGTPPNAEMTTATWSSGTLIPVSTGALTGPGTTNFVPNNTNGTAGLQNSTRFFEVNLRAAGTTFLTGTTVTIDRLNVRGASSGLNIRSGARLNTNISSYVDNGTLTVNGIFDTTALFVGGGKVMGSGTIDAPIVNSGGRIAPGNSIGTLSVIGNYVQGPSGLLEIELSNTASDVLAVTGNALVAGTAQFLSFGTAPTVGQSYTFLTTTGTVSGRFNAVQDLLPGALFPILTYNASSVSVTVADFCTFATGAVQKNTCAALNAPGVQADPDMIPAIGVLQTLDTALLPLALESLSPTRANAQAIVGLSTADLIRNQFGRRSHDLLGSTDVIPVAQMDLARSQLASSAPSAEALAAAATAAIATSAAAPANIVLSNGFGMFFAGDVAMADTRQAGGIGTDTADVAALTAGIDHSDGNGLVGGIAVSYLQSNVAQDYGLGGKTSGNGLAVSGYGSMKGEQFYLDVYASAGWQSFETDRTLLVAPFITATASGETDSSQMQAGATVGHGLLANGWARLGAVGGLYYVSMDIDGYTETGAGPLGAVIADRSIESLRSQLGGEVALHLSPDNQSLIPILRVVWNHEFMDDPLAVTAGFAGAPAVTFTAPGPDLGSDWATLGVGVTGRITDGSSFYFRYQHDLGRDGQENHEVSAAARLAF